MLGGGPGRWLFEHVAGIRNGDGDGRDGTSVAFSHAVIEVRPTRLLRYANTTLATARGSLVVDWRVDDKRLIVRVVIPPNARATIVLPDGRRECVGSGERTFDAVIDAFS
jgi:hypothetical protein